MRTRAGCQPQPAGREYSQNVPVSEESRIALQCAYSCDHTIGTDADLLWSLSARAAAIVEDCPTWAMNKNLLGGQSFVVPVVPFHQIRIDLGARAQTRQFAGLPRPSQRARQPRLEFSRARFLPQQPRLLATVLGQRDVRHAGVLTAETPFRVSVPD